MTASSFALWRKNWVYARRAVSGEVAATKSVASAPSTTRPRSAPTAKIGQRVFDPLQHARIALIGPAGVLKTPRLSTIGPAERGEQHRRRRPI